jgi:hypothetical protein
MARQTPPAARRRKPAKRGTGAWALANAAATSSTPRKFKIEVQDEGPSHQVPVQRPARGISGPMNRFAVLSDDDGEAAAEGEGPAVA